MIIKWNIPQAHYRGASIDRLHTPSRIKSLSSLMFCFVFFSRDGDQVSIKKGRYKLRGNRERERCYFSEGPQNAFVRLSSRLDSSRFVQELSITPSTRMNQPPFFSFHRVFPFCLYVQEVSIYTRIRFSKMIRALRRG